MSKAHPRNIDSVFVKNLIIFRFKFLFSNLFKNRFHIIAHGKKYNSLFGKGEPENNFKKICRFFRNINKEIFLRLLLPHPSEKYNKIGLRLITVTVALKIMTFYLFYIKNEWF